MDDAAAYGSPDNGASPNSNPILAQPPLQSDSGAAEGEGNRSMNMFSAHVPTLTEPLQ